MDESINCKACFAQGSCVKWCSLTFSIGESYSLSCSSFMNSSHTYLLFMHYFRKEEQTSQKRQVIVNEVMTRFNA